MSHKNGETGSQRRLRMHAICEGHANESAGKVVICSQIPAVVTMKLDVCGKIHLGRK